MVSSDRLSLKQRRISEAFKRRMDKRIQTIKTRGNFFEIYRNRDLFTKEDYNELLKLSLAKADNSELPPEFRDYAAHLQEYEQKNPGKFYLAAKFGAKIAGSKTRDLMSQKDYSKIFGDAPGEMPSELRKAFEKYRTRLGKERAEKDTKI